MNCRSFRQHYSDFLDGLLDEPATALARRHLADCPACDRFDAAFRAGVGALRALPAVEPSHGFGARLARRLRREAATPALQQWSGAAGALLVVAVVGVTGWEYLTRADQPSRRPAAAGRRRGEAEVGGIRPAALRLGNDSTIRFGDPFHLIPAAADTQRALYATELRFDMPAAWAGR
ncbi:MAG: zf-HC2 domain-containing protein [Gemmatimonadetes bacterium]|nr:zf-HC2 domain-containing protein [Gemmatimonadota bacterium]